MKLDIFDINEFVKVNNCPQVSNPVFFSFDHTPTKDGLFSYELFGITDDERKNTFGYIDLKDYFIHPLVYSIMKGRMGSLRLLLSGEKYAIILNKKITFVPEDYEGAETGIGFFYDHFDEINWIDDIEEGDMDSIDKKTRLKFFRSLKKEEFFINKWLVVPPYYRSENSEDFTIGDNLNKLYKELISRTNSLKAGFGLKFFGDQTKLKIQNLLLEIFLETTRPVKGKNSILRKHLLGKRIDFSASNVITAPEISKANKPDDMPVKFGYSQFPLATVVALFMPFFVTQISTLLEALLSKIKYDNIYILKNIKSINAKQFSIDKVEKLLKLFINTEEERSKPITFSFVSADGKESNDGIFRIFEYRTREDLEKNNYIERPLTYTDIVFWAAYSIIPDKHVYVTRYPAINFQNIYPTRISLMSTVKTHKELFFRWGSPDEINQPFYFKDYPFIKTENEPEKYPNSYYSFVNVMVPGNIYIKVMGGDYDGDMFYLRGVYTKEANQEASKLIFAKSNILEASGGPGRGLSKIGKEAVISLFELTKEGK